MLQMMLTELWVSTKPLKARLVNSAPLLSDNPLGIFNICREGRSNPMFD